MSGEGTNFSLILKTSVCTFLCASEVLYFWDEIEHINVLDGSVQGDGSTPEDACILLKSTSIGQPTRFGV